MSLGLGRGESDRNEVIPVAQVMTRHPHSIARRHRVYAPGMAPGEVRAPTNKYPARMSRFNQPRYGGNNFVSMMQQKKGYNHLVQRRNNELRGTGIFEQQLRQMQRMAQLQRMVNMDPKLLPVDKLTQVAEARKERDELKNTIAETEKKNQATIASLNNTLQTEIAEQKAARQQQIAEMKKWSDGIQSYTVTMEGNVDASIQDMHANMQNLYAQVGQAMSLQGSPTGGFSPMGSEASVAHSMPLGIGGRNSGMPQNAVMNAIEQAADKQITSIEEVSESPLPPSASQASTPVSPAAAAAPAAAKTPEQEHKAGQEQYSAESKGSSAKSLRTGKPRVKTTDKSPDKSFADAPVYTSPPKSSADVPSTSSEPQQKGEHTIFSSSSSEEEPPKEPEPEPEPEEDPYQLRLAKKREYDRERRAQQKAVKAEVAAKAKREQEEKIARINAEQEAKNKAKEEAAAQKQAKKKAKQGAAAEAELTEDEQRRRGNREELDRQVAAGQKKPKNRPPLSAIDQATVKASTDQIAPKAKKKNKGSSVASEDADLDDFN